MIVVGVIITSFVQHACCHTSMKTFRVAWWMDRIRTIQVSPCELANHHRESPRDLGRDSLTPVSTTRVGYPWNCKYTGLRVPG